MKLLRGIQQLLALKINTAATIGNFDGIHIGHQMLLTALKAQADRLNLPVVVLLFEPQPSEYFRGKEAPARLSSFREKVEVLRQCGVDYVCCLKFNKQLATMAATNFAEHIIFSALQAKYLLVGEDFRFGQDRLGDIVLLKEIGAQKGCTVEQFCDFYMDDKRVSSTKIRHALQEGELGYAAKLLGRPYSMCGRVTRGAGRGRQWGIPTANLSLHRLTLPLKGVFCVKVLRQGRQASAGVANIGCRPTVDGSKNILEIHLFDIDESFYGEMLQIYFLHKLRDEVKFETVEALISQIQQDITAARNWFEAGIKMQTTHDTF